MSEFVRVDTEDAVGRLLGEDVPLRFVDEVKKGLFARLFGG